MILPFAAHQQQKMSVLISILRLSLYFPNLSTTGAKRSSASLSFRLLNYHLDSLLGEEFRGGEIMIGAKRRQNFLREKIHIPPLFPAEPEYRETKKRFTEKEMDTEFEDALNGMMDTSDEDANDEPFSWNHNLSHAEERDEDARSFKPPPLPDYGNPDELDSHESRRSVRKIYPRFSRLGDDFSETESDYPSLPPSLPYDEESEDIFDPYDSYQLASSQPKARPVIYRYFGRSRVRTKSSSIPFIILGPSVEHWKATGKILTTRGFNVLACERVIEKKDRLVSKEDLDYMAIREGEGLVTEVLDALRWKKAVLVGCDDEAVVAIEAALRLAPDRVAGLVLCGDLTKAKHHVLMKLGGNETSLTVDQSFDDFLLANLACPFTVVWDGDSYRWVEPLKSIDQYDKFEEVNYDTRSVIVGGGSAPHRRLPEQFAWVLTRFVEKSMSDDSHSPSEISRAISYQEDYGKEESYDITDELRDVDAAVSNKLLGFLQLEGNNSLRRIFSPGSFLVAGRFLATAIIYISIARITIYQYQNFRFGAKGFNSLRQNLSSLRRKGTGFISKVLVEDFSRKIGVFQLLGNKLMSRGKSNSTEIDRTEINEISANENEDRSHEKEDQVCKKDYQRKENGDERCEKGDQKKENADQLHEKDDQRIEGKDQDNDNKRGEQDDNSEKETKEPKDKQNGVFLHHGLDAVVA